ncbi:hypothetical protein HRI_000958400 [Hibiscus trionum]|uniref:Uncharacterized protein n=1 Tax=Hibiscus trionum TaxID=183268 RepID=A0A9W7LR31_HIBTR|nr:hypothetical protein HRI_000958400 [Hibiscus trionum]
MAALINGIGGVRFGCQTCCSELPKISFPPSRSSCFRVRTILFADDKQTSYTLRKSQKAFNAAMVILNSFPSLPTCGLFESCQVKAEYLDFV